MLFKVVSYQNFVQSSDRSVAFLIKDGWDDWARFACQFKLVYVDDHGTKHDIGLVKVGQRGMGEGRSLQETDTRTKRRSPTLPDEFEKLDHRTFSLGQSDWYYEKLKIVERETSTPLREPVLRGLRDLAFDLDLLDDFVHEDVTEDSLMRFLTELQVRGQFHRIAHGGVRLTKYRLRYFPPGYDDHLLKFETIPESHPPSNLHVLIGRNGVGKTWLLQRITSALVDEPSHSEIDGQMEFFDDQNQRRSTATTTKRPFDLVVSVTFSAFDDLEPLTAEKYKYIGLKHTSRSRDGTRQPPKSPAALSSEFSKSVSKCRDKRAEQWRDCLSMLESDPMFKRHQITDLADVQDESELKLRAKSIFKDLSSGHKIVLLTITRLVEVLEEKTLVLIDEPESHLHPPLLSAFIRALADLLFKRNGVAIIATHSPVVLQEVPKNCVSTIRRDGEILSQSRPRIETFGESLGILTHEVFKLEVTRSGFYKMIENVVNDMQDYEKVLEYFDHQIGGEGRALIQALLADRGSTGEQ